MRWELSLQKKLNLHRLQRNYRNTAQIAQFAAPLVENLIADDIDATVPDLTSCSTQGELPQVILGQFSAQMTFAIDAIRSKVNIESQSVAFLQPLGGAWFQETKRRLRQAGLPFVEITRNEEWPDGDENIAISTIHSAKGLEFDHVFMLGLNAEVLGHGSDEDDDTRAISEGGLLAMGITRAPRVSVTLGYKQFDRSDIMDLLRYGTFVEVRL